MAQRASQAEWYRRNRTRIRAKQAAYYQRNRGAVRAQQNAARDPEDNARRCRAYYAANRAARRAKQRAWNAANPDKVRRQNVIKKARRKAMPLTEAALEYLPIILADPCAHCGAPGVTVDHITALADGGDGDWANLTGVCLSCNASKKATPLLLWLARRAA